MKRACLVAVGLGILAVTLAGCGGGGKAGHQSASTTVTQSAPPAVTIPRKTIVLDKVAYERTMKRLGKQLVVSVEQLFPLTEGQPGSDASKQTLTKLERTRAVVTTVGATVAGIAPPSPIRAEHQQLLKGISALGSELDKLIQLEEIGSTKPFGIFARFKSLHTIALATTAIEKKGYAIG